MKPTRTGRILPSLTNPQPADNPRNNDIIEDDFISKEERERIEKCVREFSETMRQEQEEINDIIASRPLGSVVHKEPKSLQFSKVPDPVWKRKLRP